MQIAFAALFDLDDVRSSSGTYFHMSRELERQGHLVHRVGPVPIEPPLITRGLAKISRALGRRYRSFQDPFVAAKIGRAATELLQGLEYDLLLTHDCCIAGYVETARPLVLYTDSVFPREYRRNVNPRLANLSPWSVVFCQRTQERALRRADLCLFPAAWAVEESRRYLPELEERASVVPFGANLEDPGEQAATERSFERILEKRRLDLLFVGKDWERKGGTIAVRTAYALRDRGIAVRLHLVGAEPPHPVDSETVKVHGLLDKSNEAQRRTLETLFREADALILPSVAEGYVIAVLEAAAYGLPVLAFDAVGVRDAVRDGETGILLPAGQPAAAFANSIEAWFANPDFYAALVRGARRHFLEEATWATAVGRLVPKLQGVLS